MAHSLEGTKILFIFGYVWCRPSISAVLGAARQPRAGLLKFFKTVLKSWISPKGFGCTDRELLAPQICGDMAVFVPTERPNRWVMVGHLREATEGDERYIEICPTPPARSYSFMLVG